MRGKSSVPSIGPDAKMAMRSFSEGVTLFTTEIHPTEDGYDFSELKDMIDWRDQIN